MDMQPQRLANGIWDWGGRPKMARHLNPEVWTPHQIDAIDFTKPLKGSPLDHGFDYFFWIERIKQYAAVLFY